jgi:hypothetical protein
MKLLDVKDLFAILEQPNQLELEGDWLSDTTATENKTLLSIQTILIMIVTNLFNYLVDKL